MMLMIEANGGERIHFKVNEFEDLDSVVHHYPQVESIIYKGSNLEEVLQNIAKYLSTSHQKVWVEGGLEKGLREKAAALGLTASMLTTPTVLQHKAPEVQFNPPKQEQTKKPETDFGKHPVDSFLWNLKQIESSGGKNTKHPMITYGVAKGSRAIGSWGLLKPTVNEIVNRARLAGKLTPDLEAMGHMDRDKLEEHLKKNPQAELDLVRNLAGHVLKRQKGDKHRAAYAWNMGHNLFPDQIGENQLGTHNYVDKFKAADKINPFNKKKADRMPASVNIAKSEVDTVFKTRIDQWYKKRDDDKTKEPTRDRNFVPDPGRLREKELDEARPESQKTSQQKLMEGIKIANKKG